MTKNSILALTLSCIFAATLSLRGAQDSPSQVFEVVNALKDQQAAIADNQTKLDEKIADLTEKIRSARLYMIRAGGTHKPLPIPKK
ncbi:MAG TPA: hypothetical protein VLK27_12605 [Chthoniobacterales bacterium]|nr:hypothetical protein [Chthoniobacterales bacterium]